MKKLFPSLLIALAACCMAACTDPVDDDPLANYDSSYKGAKITLTRDSYTAVADSCHFNVKITSTYTWIIDIAEEAQEWITASQLWGDSLKTSKVFFYVAPNLTPEIREATITIRSGKAKKRITVTQGVQPLVLQEADVQDRDKYYQPAEFTFDMLRSDSKWSWCRSKQSEHFVVFWDKEYGEYGLYGERRGVANTSPSTCTVSSMRVDIDDLLAKAELFYDKNVNVLKFCDTGKGTSVLDKYKMQIYILYQSEWLATGSGYDNNIGALWVNPSTCQPVGSTIAHEIGHCFQYMVFCDYLLQQGISESDRISADGTQGPGWRYGFGPSGAGGCGWWEQCAQWQSLQRFSAAQDYISQSFSGYGSEFTSSTYLHILHERPRYANYFIQWYWVDKYGIDFIGTLWRSAKYPEDPCETYMRLTGMDNAAFNDDMWRYAAHCVTYDMDGIRSYAKNSIGNVAITNISQTEDGWWRIADKKAPESTGSNVVQLNNAAGKTVTADFEGLYEMQGTTYKCGAKSNAGWRYGFVSLGTDGSTTYSDVYDAAAGQATWDVPANSKKLWLVVSGAPQRYERHAWPTDDKSETDTDDNRWPWQVRFTGTNPYGK